MAFELGSTMQILRPYPNIVGFYDGRIPGIRAHSAAPNWLDDGAFTLGTCSYAIVEGNEALVYDTHMSIPHAQFIRRSLEAQGVTSMRVVLSHWHTDHVAGNAVFADCEIIANTLTAQALVDNKDWLENNDPPIKPLIMPNSIFKAETELRVGNTIVQLRLLDIHSHDATVLLLPALGVLLAGDTLEDTVTYVTQADRLSIHLQDLTRMESWDFTRILPNHGSVEMIESGGYSREFITATRLYIQKLQRLKAEPDLANLSLTDFAAEVLATGGVFYFGAYEPVHRHNVEAVLALPG
ncbi:MAG: fold metallo-hydrolase [Devosia sp.]|uniref:MBL fold metallo-hydrolase n=1 Tax=Devosia sp. TaxID=1871048 RepID=UPI0026391A0B|nr:MBL fold metallo-hydrolase [Devosia sp.]MDB5537508.1 fold metallo-hydrolase [Devosia sp.]MDB5586050.1 fold metallo-hydrolase [Devosia sp.]